MDTVTAETTVFVPAEEVFEFLSDFPGYARYSSYLESVAQLGDGGEGTSYRLTLSWWKLTYPITTVVTELDPPHSIHWKTTSAIDAAGSWQVEPIYAEGEAPETQVTLTINYNTATSSVQGIDLPRFISTQWVINRVKPLVEPEAKRIVKRIVTDLEGEERPIDLTITSQRD